MNSVAYEIYESILHHSRGKVVRQTSIPVRSYAIQYLHAHVWVFGGAGVWLQTENHIRELLLP